LCPNCEQEEKAEDTRSLKSAWRRNTVRMETNKAEIEKF
jgi:hypothetical protein